MWKIILVISFLTSVKTAVNAQEIFSADSVSFGPKSVFMEVCLKNMKNELNETENLYSTFDFCNCMAVALLPTLTKNQINYYFNEGHLSEMFEDEASKTILYDCIYQSINFPNPPQEIIENEE